MLNKKEQEWANFTYRNNKYKKTGLGMYFRYIRMQQKLTTKQVAELSGLNSAVVCQVETGRTKNPTARVVYKIAKALEIDMPTLAEVFEQEYA